MTVIERPRPCMVECFGGPCGRRKDHDGHHATVCAHHLDEKDDLRKQLQGAVQALREIEHECSHGAMPVEQRNRALQIARGELERLRETDQPKET